MTGDAEDWEACAGEAAKSLRLRLESLRDNSPRGKQLWLTIKQLEYDIAHAPAILLEDKMQLQQELQQCKRDLRQQAVEREREARERFRSLSDALALTAEALQESRHLAQLQDVRADLALVREQMDEARSILHRVQRQQLWDCWQGLNTTTWERMQQSKQAQGTELAAYLDAAEAQLTARKPQDAKASIKQFHAAAQEVDSTRGTLEQLRTRARKLWQQANEIGAEKHRNHVRWLQTKIRHAERERTQADVQRRRALDALQQLEDQMGGVSTDVGAALLRGQLATRQREVRDADVKLRRAEREIQDLRSAVGEP